MLPARSFVSKFAQVVWDLGSAVSGAETITRVTAEALELMSKSRASQNELRLPEDGSPPGTWRARLLDEVDALTRALETGDQPRLRRSLLRLGALSVSWAALASDPHLLAAEEVRVRPALPGKLS